MNGLSATRPVSDPPVTPSRTSAAVKELTIRLSVRHMWKWICISVTLHYSTGRLYEKVYRIRRWFRGAEIITSLHLPTWICGARFSRRQSAHLIGFRAENTFYDNNSKCITFTVMTCGNEDENIPAVRADGNSRICVLRDIFFWWSSWQKWLNVWIERMIWPLQSPQPPAVGFGGIKTRPRRGTGQFYLISTGRGDNDAGCMIRGTASDVYTVNGCECTDSRHDDVPVAKSRIRNTHWLI
jgi:hypothetical protein